MSASSNNTPSTPSDNTPPRQPQPGRDARGRYLEGRKAGPGNPYNRRVAALRQLLLERVSDDDLAAIVAQIIKQAKQGDLAAIRLLFSAHPAPPSGGS